ncbi:MAG: helix-turn-helix transcriptional regulator [Clostridiaceae bacterium]|nr:helix-turn-helix transcriptional regulator [Clostridiaceae bacterium]
MSIIKNIKEKIVYPLLNKKGFKLSYLFVFVIPLLFNFISYKYTGKFIAETYVSTNVTLLRSSQTFLDAILNSIVSSVSSLSSNKDIMEIAYWGNPASTQRYDLNLSNRAWESYDINSEYIKKKYIYYPETDSIYTGTTLTPTHFHYMYAYNGETVMTEQIWRNAVLDKSASGFTSIPSSGEARVFFTFLTHNPATKNIFYNTVVELDFNRLITAAAGENMKRFFMYASDGTVISTDLNEDELEAIQELLFVRDDGKPYYKSTNNSKIFKTKSQISNWKYGYIATNEYVEKSMALLKSTVFSVSLLCILISLIIIRRNEKPLQEIAELLPDIKDTDNKDIYQQINTSLEKIINEKDDYEFRLNNQNNIFKENILTNMLLGKKNDKFSYPEQLSLIGLKMENTMFATIAFCTPDISQIFSNENYNASVGEKQHLAQFIISNIMGETLGKYCKTELVSMGSFSVAIVNLSEAQSENFKSDITFILETYLEIISKEFNFDVIAAISNPHVSISCINDAFNESVSCMEYAISSSESIAFYNDMVLNSKRSHHTDIEEEIKKYLNEKNYRQCKKVIENAILRFQQNKNISTLMARSFAYDLLTTFFRNVIPNTNETLEMFMTGVEMNSIMSESTTTSGILLKTITIIDRYLDKYDTSEDEKDINEKNNFYLQIKNYIDEHYSNPNLNVNELSTIFKINSSYLSSQFKKEFNIGLLDFITSVRIEAAKKLLLNSDKSNTEISQYVGYSNVRTFLRAFSKCEGTTPKVYRRIYNPSA